MAYNYLADLVGENVGQPDAAPTPWTGGITGTGEDPVLNRPPQTQQATAPNTNWNTGSWDANRVRSYFQSRGVTPFGSSPDYWAGKWNEWGKNDPNYFMQRLTYADEFLPGQNPANSPYYEGSQQMAPTTGVQGRQGGNSVAPTWANMLNNSSAYNKNNGQTSLAALAGLNGYQQ